MNTKDALFFRILRTGGISKEVAKAILERTAGGGAALKYGRFTSTAAVLSSNVEDWVLASGATDLAWTAGLGGLVLNEPGLYAVHAAAQIDTGATPIDSPGELQLGYSGSGMNLATPIPVDPQDQRFSCAGNFLFTDPAEDTNEIYVAANFSADPTGFASVDYELAVVRLGDPPVGAEA
jgi:hypothetical protein